MQTVILAADQEKHRGRASVRRAKVNGLEGAPHHQKGSFKHMCFVAPRMRQRKAARHAGGAKAFALLQTFEQGLGIIQAAGGISQRHKFPQSGSFRFCRHRRSHKSGLDHGWQDRQLGQKGRRVAGGFLVIIRQIFFRQIQNAPGSPRVNFAFVKNDPLAAGGKRDLPAFDPLPDIFQAEVQITGHFVFIQKLMFHKARAAQKDPSITCQPRTAVAPAFFAASLMPEPEEAIPGTGLLAVSARRGRRQDANSL